MKRSTHLIMVVMLFTMFGCQAGNGSYETVSAMATTSENPAISANVEAESAISSPSLKNSTDVTATMVTRQEPWTMKIPFPTARFELRAVALGDKLYVLGGSDGKLKLGVAEVYDPALDSWSEIADLPVAVNCVGAAALNGKIYAFMKDDVYDSPASVYEYNITKDKWSKISDMTTARSNFGVAVLGNEIYIVGGLINTDAEGHFKNLKTVEAFDPASLQWTKKADMNTPKHAIAVVAVDGKVYALGGSVTQANWDYPSKGVEVYDPAADMWTSKATMLLDSAYHCAAAIGGKIYVTGGLLKQFLLIYDPAADKWSSGTRRNIGSWQNAAASLDGKMYVVGGTTDTSDNWVPENTLEAYDPASEGK